MNNEEKITAAASVGVIVITIVSVIKSRKRTSKMIAEINAEGSAQVEAIQKAAATVKTLMDKGEYDRTGLAGIYSDLKFFEIAHREE